MKEAAVGKFVWLLEDEYSPKLFFSGKGGLDGKGPGIFIGPPIQTVKRICRLRFGLVEELREGQHVQIDKGVRLGCRYSCQRRIECQCDSAGIVRRISGRWAARIHCGHKLPELSRS